MGLDMYLTHRKYVKNWAHMKPEEKHIITISKGGIPVESKLPVTEVVYEAAYWRKANAIHNWFVQNTQGGDDKNGEETWVSREQLQELLDLCKQVLQVAKVKPGKMKSGTKTYRDDKGELVSEQMYEDGMIVTNPEEVGELLPPTSGFFFGSTEIDGYYLDDVKSTIEQLELALSEEGGDFYYQSSW